MEEEINHLAADSFSLEEQPLRFGGGGEKHPLDLCDLHELGMRLQSIHLLVVCFSLEGNSCWPRPLQSTKEAVR